MAAWRTLGSAVVLLAAAAPGRAQTYPLTEAVKAGDCFRVRIDMSLTGELKVGRDDKVLPVRLAATAAHEYPERVLHVGASGLPEKAARAYETARAVIDVAGEKSERSLRADRRLLVAQRPKDQPLVYCPAGMLTRDELALASEHFDTLALTGLLPGRAVAVGDTWKVANAVVQALCNFEGLTEQDLSCKLEEVKDGTARVSVTGSAAGIELGALAKLSIRATYHIDHTAKRLVRLEWKQTDDRDQGPASPATTAEVVTTVRRTPIDQPAALSDVALVSVPDGFEPPATLTNLVHRDPKGRFDLAYGREWHVVSQTDEHVVMRLMERGEFVAQVTLTPWKKAERGGHLSPQEFRDVIAKTPGWEPETELQAGEVPSEPGRWTYRVSALGTLDGVKVLQNFFLLAGRDGDQLMLLFTMTPKQADRLGSRDLALVGSVELPGRK
jgi:hypothetical protein